jgi:hypothetical protein
MISALIALGGVTLGWLLNESSGIFTRRRERQTSAREAFAVLLALLDQIRLMQSIIEEFTDVEERDVADMGRRAAAGLRTRAMGLWGARLERAIATLASIDPFMAAGLSEIRDAYAAVFETDLTPLALEQPHLFDQYIGDELLELQVFDALIEEALKKLRVVARLKSSDFEAWEGSVGRRMDYLARAEATAELVKSGRY